MPELKHSELDSYLSSLKASSIPRVILVWGDAFLCRQAFKSLIAVLLPKKENDLGYEPLEGEDAAMASVVERLTTLSLMLDHRVIAIKNAAFTSSPGNPGYSKDELELLEKCIVQGIPDQHTLVITASAIDRRRSLFKTLKQNGLCIDATVPDGNRQADVAEKEAALWSVAGQILKGSGKRLDPQGFKVLVEKIGFDPGTLSDNLEKLIAYSGDRSVISCNDIETLVRRSRQDAVFELTNAVAEKNSSQALFFLASLKKAGFHPLQILAALTNQMRKIAAVRYCIESSKNFGKPCWEPGLSYAQFRQVTMPRVVEQDTAMLKTAAEWDEQSGSDSESRVGKKKNALTDLLIAPNPKNTYPVYHTFLKSDNFSQQEIAKAFIAINQADLKMKSTGSDPSLILDDLVISLCAKGDHHDSKNQDRCHHIR